MKHHSYSTDRDAYEYYDRCLVLFNAVLAGAERIDGKYDIDRITPYTNPDYGKVWCRAEHPGTMDFKRVIDRLNEINRKYLFKNYYQTMAFTNSVAWIAHQEDHHPDMTVSYHHCHVHFSSHAIGGLSENDFICAAKIDALIK